MKNRILIIAVAVFLASLSTLHLNVHSQQPVAEPARYAPDQIIVKLRSDAKVGASDREVADLVLPSRARGGESLGGGRLYTVRLDPNASVEEAIRQAEANPAVEYAEPDYYLHHTAMPNDSFFNFQWGLFNNGDNFGKPGADIGATQTWDLTQGSQDIVVAVIDTGIDYNHPDLAQNIWANPAETPGNGTDDDRNGLIDDRVGWNFADGNSDPGPAGDFHGTHVAGIVGAPGNNGIGVSGVAWRVKLMALKFISGRNGKTSNAVKAINYAADQRRRGVGVRVINASWGGENDSNSLREAIRSATSEGILFVCAAGNGGEDQVSDNNDVTPFFPSQLSSEMSGVISVAALDRGDRMASFSNYGHQSVSIGAPGVGVFSTFPGGGYGNLSGTSMAAPHVAGAAVLIWSREPGITPSQVKARIVSRSVPVLALASRVAASARAYAYNAVTDTAPSAPELGINEVLTSKKVLTIDGLGFKKDSMTIRVGQTEVSKVKYPDDFEQATDTFTRMTVKLGKSQMNALIPKQTPVTIEVIDTTTGGRVSVTHVRN